MKQDQSFGKIQMWGKNLNVGDSTFGILFTFWRKFKNLGETNFFFNIWWQRRALGGVRTFFSIMGYKVY